MSISISLRRLTLSLGVFFLSVGMSAAMVSVTVPQSDPVEVRKLTYSKKMTVAEAESVMGREMSGVERMAFKMNKKRYVKAYNKAAAEGKGDTDGMAIAGFVLSLLIPILGLVFSAIALGRIKKNKTGGKGLATAGLIIGIVMTVVGILILF
jgi:hypothetical protein